METLSIEGSTVNPKVYFSPADRLLEISGYSRPENAREFYMNLIQWIDDYKNSIIKDIEDNNPSEPITLKFNFIYFNSSSAKFINDIMLVFSEIQKNNIPIKVYWYFDEDDDELKEAGEEFSEMANIPFHYVEVSH
jgi:hypothetical protein